MEKRKAEKEDSPRPKRRYKPIPWSVTVTAVTFVVAFFLGIFADVLSKNLSFLIALLVLVIIILIGILADMVGLAVATAGEKSLNAMAARKIGGSKEALVLIHNAEKTTNIFNDVIGDIAGIVSGATVATIGVHLLQILHNILSGNQAQLGEFFLLSFLSAVVAAMTVGGKAVGKKYAIRHAEKIVFIVGKAVYFCKQLVSPITWFRRK